jgi:predicted transcriptional regulator
VTPLSDALTAAQRSALAALEKGYVAGAIQAERFTDELESCGISDPVDVAFLLCSLRVLREWGVSAPTMSERVKREVEFATESQQKFIRDLCERNNLPAPEAMGALTKESASEIIDSLQKDGTYDQDKFGVPF